MKEEMTIDELTQIIKSGFDETATKTELRALAEQTHQNFEAIREDMHNLKRDLIATVLSMHDQKVEDLEHRVARLEKKIGLET